LGIACLGEKKIKRGPELSGRESIVRKRVGPSVVNIRFDRTDRGAS